MGKRVSNIQELVKGNAGDFCYVNDFKDILINYPVKTDYIDATVEPQETKSLFSSNFVRVPIMKPGDTWDRAEKPWSWDGNIEHPTITPSINVVGIWHGFMTNGELSTC